MQLLQLFKEDKYKEFCLNYQQDFMLSVEDLHSDVEKNIPYMEYILHQKKENYDLSYIEYLAEHRRSDIIIDFFESIKVRDESEFHNCDKLLKTICTNKDIVLFSYLSSHPAPKLSKFDYQARLIDIFMSEGFKEGVELVAKKIPNPHMFLIDNVLNRGLVLSRDEFVSLDINYSFIENADLLMSGLLDYYDSPNVARHREIVRSYTGADKEQMLHASPSYIMDRAVFKSIGTGGPTMNSSQLKAFMSKRKLHVHFKSDKVAKAIWSKYKLESTLKDKDSQFKKEVKI